MKPPPPPDPPDGWKHLRPGDPDHARVLEQFAAYAGRRFTLDVKPERSDDLPELGAGDDGSPPPGLPSAPGSFVTGPDGSARPPPDVEPSAGTSPPSSPGDHMNNLAVERGELAAPPAIVSASDRNAAVLYLASLSSGSRPTMAGALRDLARFFGGERPERPERFDWHRLRYQDTQGARSWLVERYAPATGNRYLSALRGVLRQAFRLGVMSEEAYRRAADLDPIRGSNETAGRALERGELAALFAACDPSTPLGARNAAMLALLYGAGLRRAEVVALDLADYDGDRKLNVRGKGRKVRSAYLPRGAVAALAAWLRFRGLDAGPLLYPTHGGRPGVRGLHRRRMCPDAVRLALRGVAKRAAVAACSPHDFRRTFVGDLLDAGEDLATVQRLAGHSNANTTARYDRRPERRRARAAELLSVPFVAGESDGE